MEYDNEDNVVGQDVDKWGWVTNSTSTYILRYEYIDGM